MRILLVAAWPIDTPGGTQTLVRSLAGALARADTVEVDVVTGTMPERRTLPLPSPGYRWRRLPLRTEPRPTWLPPDDEIVGRAWLEGLEKSLAARADAIVCVSHHSAEAHQAAAVAARLGIPLVLWPLIHLDQPRHVNATAVDLYRRAAVVVASSGAERHWLVGDARVDEARVLLLECGSWAAESPLPAVRLARRGGGVRLLGVGEFAAHKRLEDQVEALARLRASGIEARLTLAGVAHGRAGLERIRALSAARGLDHVVSLAPWVSEGDLRGLYASADYFLFTSASESFGLALLDAICGGVFPVVYPHPVYAGLLAASGFGRIAAGPRPEALATALRESIEAGEPRGGPACAWRAAHAWPRVASALLERLAAFSR